MKKNLIGIVSFLLLLISPFAQAQTYNNAVGLEIDLGNGITLAGAQYKHFLSGNNAVNAQILFGGSNTLLGADYTFNQNIESVEGLSWYAGGGAQLAFAEGGTWFGLRPSIGLDYKLAGMPVVFHFGWKPWWNLSNESNLEMGRFSLGIQYVLN
ncbi:MAG: hypothetical protein RBT46_04075 [Weeksellaceae bacterium]|jgi:hypothetical protein|nr:hypothetical protein [Weeksellaceae bacterium]MDX9704868.1 hypothetical protein [Weeksellaceae bacterium]